MNEFIEWDQDDNPKPLCALSVFSSRGIISLFKGKRFADMAYIYSYWAPIFAIAEIDVSCRFRRRQITAFVILVVFRGSTGDETAGHIGSTGIAEDLPLDASILKTIGFSLRSRPGTIFWLDDIGFYLDE